MAQASPRIAGHRQGCCAVLRQPAESNMAANQCLSSPCDQCTGLSDLT
jgi:hypothetical protein